MSADSGRTAGHSHDVPAETGRRTGASRRSRPAGKWGWTGGIAGKLFLSFLGMAVVTIGLLWIIQAGLMRDSYVKSRVTAMDQAIRQAAASGNPNLETLRNELNTGLISLNNDGSLRASTQGLPMMGMGMGMGGVTRLVQSMVPDKADGTPQILTNQGGIRYALLGHPVSGGGYLFAVFSLADADEAARILRDQLGLISLILFLSAICFAVMLSRVFARPIRAVTGAARALAAGNLDVSLPVTARDEIGELTVALNELSGQLHKTENLRKELIANVSHELRAPLAVIRGYAETVRDVSWPDEARRTSQLDMIANEAARLSRVVTDILDYSKLQAGVDRLAPGRFGIRDALGQAVRRHELHAAEQGCRIVWDAPAADVRFDRDKFDQVLDNLLNNAINHADPETEIRIGAAPAASSAVAAGAVSGTVSGTVSGAAAGAVSTATAGAVTVLRITVCNRGEDIPREELPLIWERFHRVQTVDAARRHGTGLGLSIVKSILERHGVDFGVRSGGRETCFWFDTCPPES